MDRIQVSFTREQAEALLTLLEQDVPNEYYEQGRADSPRWKHMLTHRIDLLNAVRSQLESAVELKTPGQGVSGTAAEPPHPDAY